MDAELHSIVAEMFRVMYEARGVGLAANQVDLPLRLFVANLISDPEEGEEYVFINPVIDHRQGMEEREEGCLSLPELYGKVRAWIQTRVICLGRSGESARGSHRCAPRT